MREAWAVGALAVQERFTDVPPGLGNFGQSMNTYVHPVRTKRLAKNTYGAHFRLLSARSKRGTSVLP